MFKPHWLYKSPTNQNNTELLSQSLTRKPTLSNLLLIKLSTSQLHLLPLLKKLSSQLSSPRISMILSSLKILSFKQQLRLLKQSIPNSRESSQLKSLLNTSGLPPSLKLCMRPKKLQLSAALTKPNQ